MNMKFFLKCTEAVNVCDKSQYEEATFFDKLLLRIHLLYCSLCRGYSFRNRKLTQAIKESDIKTLPDDQKQLIKERLRQAMANQ